MPAGRDRRQASLRVFVVCWLIYAVSWAPFIVREHYPALTIAETGTLNVERYLGWTEDIFPVNTRGHENRAVINNNPGASLTGAIPLILLRPVLSAVDSWNQRQPAPARRGPEEGEAFWRAVAEGRGCYFLLAGFLTAAAVMAPATAATLALLCSRLVDAGIPRASASLIAILCGIGTPLLFRSGLLNHNLLVADAAFTALLLLWDAGNRSLTPARAFWAGLLSGYALLCDYSGIVVIATVALYIWQLCAGKQQRIRALAGFVAGSIPGIAILLIYQAWAFGSFYHPSQQYLPPTAPTSHGYRGFDWPSPALAWALLMDPRFGLFAYTPALALAFAAPFLKKVRYRLPPRETGLILTNFALFLLFCSANRYSWLQPLTGFRYMVPVVPGLALLSIQASQALPGFARKLLACLSCAEMLALTAVHENDIRQIAGALWTRGLEPLWLIRLGEAGAPPAWIRAAAVAALIALALALIQIVRLVREAVEPSPVGPVSSGRTM